MCRRPARLYTHNPVSGAYAVRHFDRISRPRVRTHLDSIRPLNIPPTCCHGPVQTRNSWDLGRISPAPAVLSTARSILAIAQAFKDAPVRCDESIPAVMRAITRTQIDTTILDFVIKSQRAARTRSISRKYSIVTVLNWNGSGLLAVNALRVRRAFALRKNYINCDKEDTVVYRRKS